MDFVQVAAAAGIGGLRGLLTVIATLLAVGIAFVIVELIDRRGGPAAASTGAGRAASESATSGRPGAARPNTDGTSARVAGAGGGVGGAAGPGGVTDFAADVPADDIWPLRPTGQQRESRPVHPSLTRVLVSTVVGTILALAVALVLIPIRSEIGLASIALALVLVVVGAAAAGGRITAAVTSAVAALSFNFMHTAPLYTFHIAETSNIVTSVLMIVIGISVGEVAVRTFRAGVNDST